MALVLMEATIDAIKDYLETNMAAKIAALNTEYGDFTLDGIQAYYIAELAAIPEQPAILILGDKTDVEREADNYLKGRHTVSVVVVATDQDAEQLRRKLYRYVRAVVELLREARSSVGWGYIINFDSFEFSPMFGKGHSFLQDARVLVHLNKTDMA